MANIFISYSRKDNETGEVSYFVQKLQKGRPSEKIWWDQELRSGEEW